MVRRKKNKSAAEILEKEFHRYVISSVARNLIAVASGGKMRKYIKSICLLSPSFFIR